MLLLEQLQQQLAGRTVAVLLGGVSAERDVSLRSGKAVLAALEKLGVNAVAVDTQASHWIDELAKNYQHSFISLHGIQGEDGTVQAILDLLNISYTGSGMQASAIAMDKFKSKLIWKALGIPTADFFISGDQQANELMSDWGCAMVKPVTEGSSIGMSKVSSITELEQAISLAEKYCDTVMVERWISGEEYTVAILGDEALPAIRLNTDKEFYNFEAKYKSNDTQYSCPCGLDADKESSLKALALDAFKALGCSGWGRIDVMADEHGNFQVLEVNTSPGMTEHSLVPMAAKEYGLNFNELVAKVLLLSLQD